MALFKSTARARKLTDSILVERHECRGGNSISLTPIIANGGQDLADTFMRVYGRLKESRNLKLSVFGNNQIEVKYYYEHYSHL